MENYDSTKDTQAHIGVVRDLISLLRRALQMRELYHDRSKLSDQEKPIFDEFTPKLKHSTYGSDEYNGFLKKMGVALDHHYANNRHHPEHFGVAIKCKLCNAIYNDKAYIGTICKECNSQKIESYSTLNSMNLVDIIEMFCDWKAATMRHADGDIIKSIEINKKRFGYGSTIEAIFKNTAKLFEELWGIK